MQIKPPDTVNMYSRLSQSGSDMTSLVSATGKEFGLPDGQMNSVGMVESGLKADAANGQSSAKGLFQFTGGTWNEQMTKYGDLYGIPKGTKPTDATASSILGARYMKDNADNYRELFGKEPELTDVYMGHFLGNRGRAKFVTGLNSDPNTPAHTLVSKRQANANKEIFFNADGSARSANEVYQLFGNKLTGAESTGEKVSLTQMTGDFHVDQMQELALSREFLGVNSDENAELAASNLRSGAKGLTVPLSGDAGRFTDTAASYALKPEQAVDEESSFAFPEWQAVTSAVGAELRLSSAGRMVADGVTDMQINLQKDFGLNTGLDPAAMQVMELFSEMDPTEFAQLNLEENFKLSPAMLEQSMKGLDAKWTDYINSALNPKDLVKRVQAAGEMAAAEKARQGAGLGTGLVAGAVGMLGDPTTLMGGGALKAGHWGTRMLFAGGEGAAANTVNEYMLKAETEGGVETNMVAAALSGVIAGATLRGVADSFTNMRASMRMRAQQESNMTGLPDPTMRPDVEIPEGKTYAELPGEPGAVVDGAGNTHSATSAGNPRTHDIAQEVEEELQKGRRGAMPIEALNTISQNMWRSDDNAARSVISKMARPPTGLKDGSSGAAEMNMEDILTKISGQDKMWHNKAVKQWSNIPALKQEGSDAVGRRITEAVESGDLSKLSKQEREFAENWQELMTRKHDEATNPAQFGNVDAPPVVNTKRDPRNYVSQIFEEGKVARARERFGKTSEGLKQAIKDNWKVQWKANHKGVRDVFKQTMKDELDVRVKAGEDADDALEALAAEYMEKKAYGISQNGDFTHSNGLDDVQIDDALTGLANNNFAKERNVFDSGFSNTATDGQPFALNELRHFDMMNIAGQYNRTINGSVATHGATGKTVGEWTKVIEGLSSKDRESATELMKAAMGRRRESLNTYALNTAMRGLQNMGFYSNSGTMWSNNLAEVSGYTSHRMQFVLRNGIPAMKQLLNPAAKLSKADLKDMHSMLFGDEVETALYRGFQNSKDALVQRGVNRTVAGVAAGLETAGHTLANGRLNYATKVLNHTQEAIVGMARKAVIGDLVQEAFGGIKLRPEQLHKYSITPEQHKGILRMLKQHTKLVDGRYVPDVKAMAKHPNINDMFRLGDAMGSDMVMRTGKLGDTLAARPNFMLNAALQFKKFSLLGLNRRTVRMFHDSFSGHAVDNAMRVVVGTGITSMLYAGQLHLRASYLPEKDREAFLKKGLDPVNLAYNALSRSSELGPLLGGFSIAANAVTGDDIFKIGRSTVDPRSMVDRDPLRSDAATMKTAAESTGARFYDTFPIARTATGVGVMASGAFGWATEEKGYREDMEKRAFFEGLATAAQNEPATQWLINKLAEQFGASDRNMK